MYRLRSQAVAYHPHLPVVYSSSGGKGGTSEYRLACTLGDAAMQARAPGRLAVYIMAKRLLHNQEGPDVLAPIDLSQACQLCGCL